MEPTFHQVFFCSPKTSFYQLEEFVCRAMFGYSRNRGMDPVYVIVCFEKLSLGL